MVICKQTHQMNNSSVIFIKDNRYMSIESEAGKVITIDDGYGHKVPFYISTNPNINPAYIFSDYFYNVDDTRGINLDEILNIK